MATPPSNPLFFLLQRSFPTIVSADKPDTDVSELSPKLYPDTTYTAPEQKEIAQWVEKSSHLSPSTSHEDPLLKEINTYLTTRTTILGSKPSIADLALYARLAPLVKNFTPEQRTGQQGVHHVVRFVDFVQNSSVFGLKLAEEEKVAIDPANVLFVPKPVDPKEEKERKKKEKAAAAAGAEGEKPLVVGGQGKPAKAGKEAPPAAEGAAAAAPAGAKKEKKEKKEKAPKQPKPAPVEAPLSPSLIDLRVGHILRAIAHPNADSLYVSTIACGDAPGTDNTSQDAETGQTVRTVCSGLNGLVPLEEMQGRKVIVVCNLKPVTMRGVKSAAMVLAASPRLAPGVEDKHEGPVELVNPPADAPAGERVCFEGWEGEPEGVLNPKKKVWEMCQVGFTTTSTREVAFEAGVVEQLKDKTEGKPAVGLLKTKSGGVCLVKSLTGAVVR